MKDSNSYPTDLHNSFAGELCHFAMFIDISKDDEPEDISPELFLYRLISEISLGKAMTHRKDLSI